MRIRELAVQNWRQIEHINIKVPDENNIVALVGENGVGKSNLLQLISEILIKVGVQDGQYVPRKSFLNEPHELSIVLDFSDQLEAIVDFSALSEHITNQPELAIFDNWKGQLRVESVYSAELRRPRLTLEIDGHRESDSEPWVIRSMLSNLSQAHYLRHLHLDANRVFEKEENNWAYMIEQGQGTWTPEIQRLFAFRETKDIFKQWQSWLHQTEVSTGMDMLRNLRKTSFEAGAEFTTSSVPQIKDLPHANYADSLNRALPHLQFLGADPQAKSIRFSSHGRDIDFFDLSAGEREIAYILGQIDRFNLDNGMLLVDEPELHLHPRLVTEWLLFLGKEINRGQVWIATHSYEAIEAIGLGSAIILVSDPSRSGTVMSCGSDTQELRRKLFDSIGIPGLTLHGKSLVMVEGGSKSAERLRFQHISANPPDIVFLPYGNNKEDVEKATRAYSELEIASDQTIYVRGIVDSDFTSADFDSRADADTRLLRLSVHEVENLFLAPGTLDRLATENGILDFSSLEVIQDASDELAGMWVFGHASQGQYHDWSAKMGGYDSYETFKSQINGVNLKGLASEIATFKIQDRDIAGQLGESLRQFEILRTREDWWKHVLGKQVLSKIPKKVGFASRSNLEAASYRIWESNPELVPREIMSIRAFLSKEGQSK